MTATNKLEIVKDLPGKKITITRHFDAAPEQVWKAWTVAEILDRWWAPKPWRAETKSMTFKEGGYWIYSMVGPNNERHWAINEYKKIEAPKRIEALDSFCDEQGNINKDFPTTPWKISFHKTETGTKVIVVMTFDSEPDMQKLIEMGFETGFTMALTNLDELLKQGI